MGNFIRLGFFLFISILYIILVFIFEEKDDKSFGNYYFPHSLVCWFLGGIFGIFLYSAMEYNEPKAIDVYRNQTEIIINKSYINDSIIKSDSIVILKK